MGGKRQCQFQKASGAVCRAPALACGGYCYFHGPGMARTRTEARRLGGENSRKPAAVLPPETPDLALNGVPDVLRWLGETANQVRRGQLSPSVGNCLGFLLSVGLRALEME